MWPYYPELLATPVPRYTSYPTAADFGPLDETAHLRALECAEGDLSLYVHIPFCEKICYYCGCNTAASGRERRLQSYLFALHSEIDMIARHRPARTKVKRISFGGGSPNALAPVDFVRLVDALTVAFDPDDPIWSIELDPRTLTPEWGAVIERVGITRASLGVQTFDSACQAAIGRVQDENTILRSVDLLRNAGIASLNFDLMYGLPGQTEDQLIDTLHRTRVLGADRVALFGYAHVPHIVPRQRMIAATNLPGQEMRFQMAAMGYAYLVTHGYTPVGFDHFARPGGDPLAKAAMAGTLHRNFQGFTEDDAPILLGLGASAISSFPQLLAQNEKNSGRYRMIASQHKPLANRGVLRSVDDRRRSRIIERLLCHGEAQVDADLMTQTACALQPFVARGLANIADNVLTIDPDGLPYARTIAALFDSYRAQPGTNFSSAI
ncbi:MAG: radical SAM protein [Sphingomonadaceae bacterium]